MNLSDDHAIDFAQVIQDVIKEDIAAAGLSDLPSKTYIKDEALTAQSLVKDEIKLVGKELKLVKEHIRKLELKIEQTKGELNKNAYWIGLLQFLGIIGATLAIIAFMMHK